MHRSVLAALCALSMSLSAPAHAWDPEEDNALYIEISEDLEPTDDRFAWMDADVALAAAWLADGDADGALAITGALDRAIRQQIAGLVALRGEAGALDLHRQVQALVRRAGGDALAEVELPSS